MNNKRDNNVLMLIINLFIVVSTLIVILLDVKYGAGAGQLGELSGINCFKAFTIDSNVLNALFSLIVLFFNIDNVIHHKDEMPSWLSLIQYVGATAVSLTLCVVVILLAPMQVLKGNSYLLLFENDMFFLHLLNPLLSIIETILLLNHHKFAYKENIYACIPTIIYSIVYAIMVLTYKWVDFYNFTFGYKMYMVPIMFIGMCGFTYLLGFLLRIFHNRIVINE